MRDILFSCKSLKNLLFKRVLLLVALCISLPLLYFLDSRSSISSFIVACIFVVVVVVVVATVSVVVAVVVAVILFGVVAQAQKPSRQIFLYPSPVHLPSIAIINRRTIFPRGNTMNPLPPDSFLQSQQQLPMLLSKQHSEALSDQQPDTKKRKRVTRACDECTLKLSNVNTNLRIY